MLNSWNIEPSVTTGQDPRSYAKQISAIYDSAISGMPCRERPRDVIWQSWQRMLHRGLMPDRPVPNVLARDAVELLREQSGLANIADGAFRKLGSFLDPDVNVFSITDSKSTVLWRRGPGRVLKGADKLGFVEGARWSESTVGTNAMGTALVSQQTVQTFSAEHYNRNQHPWTCAATPIRHPRTGKLLGTINVTGPAFTVHPTTLALVDAVGRLIEVDLKDAYDAGLQQLRAVSAPILAKMACPAVAVDIHGWVVAVDSLPITRQVVLPTDMGPGQVWIPSIGLCKAESLPGGWLLTRTTENSRGGVGKVVLNFVDNSSLQVEVNAEFGVWSRAVSLRHAEILAVLAAFPSGRSAQELAADLYGDHKRVGAVRVELSRLRGQFFGLLDARPYRFNDLLELEVRISPECSSILQASAAPAIRKLDIDGAGSLESVFGRAATGA